MTDDAISAEPVGETVPRRVRLSRTKGYRKPEGAVTVARPSKWGNPFPVDGTWMVWTAVGLGYMGNKAGRRAAAVALHRAWLTGEAVQLGEHAGSTAGGSIEFADGTERPLWEHLQGIARSAAVLMGERPTVPSPPIADLHELRGCDLACWCPLDEPCHADVLLTLANATDNGGQQ